MNTWPDQKIVFHYENKELALFLKYFPIFVVSILGMIPIILWFSVPSGAFFQINWLEIWQKITIAPAKLISVFLHLLAGIAAYWAASIYAKNARIEIDTNSLNYSFGIPILSRWIDWRLDFADLHSGKTSFQLVKHQRLALPNVKDFQLTLGQYGLRRIQPYSWVLPNQRVTHIQKRTFLVFDLLQGKRPEDKILLQNEFNQLPLVKALINYGVNLPKLENAGKHRVGLDLMAHPRMKIAVIGFFVSMVAAFALFHLMRHQHYFVSQSPFWMFIFGALVGLGMFAWLWAEEPSDGKLADKVGFRLTQALLAGLLAVAAGLCAPSLPLLLSNFLQPAQEQNFVLQKEPLALKSKDAANMPDIQPTQAFEYWQSLKEGAIVNLPVRQGFAGLWWQYDSSVLQDKVEAFYGSLPR